MVNGFFHFDFKLKEVNYLTVNLQPIEVFHRLVFERIRAHCTLFNSVLRLICVKENKWNVRMGFVKTHGRGGPGTILIGMSGLETFLRTACIRARYVYTVRTAHQGDGRKV